MTTSIEVRSYYGTAELSRIESIQDTYSYHAKDFVQWCRAMDYGVTEESVKEYFIYLNQRNDYAAGTKRIKRQAVKKRVRQLLENAPIEEQLKLDRVLKNLDTFGDTKAPKIASNAVRRDCVINEAERQLLLARATKRVGMMMEFLWMTGCRVSEMTTATVGKCKREGEKVDITVTGKGSIERHVMIRATLYDKIRALYRGEEFLFETLEGKPYKSTYVSDQIAKLGKKVLRRTISAHSYRHSFATRKIRDTGNLKGVSEYLGHSSTAITADMYDHNLLSSGDLLEAELID